MSNETLFESYQLGPLTLKNRIVMAPLTRSRSTDEGVPAPFAADYYAQRASAGLIIAEATNISAQGRGYAYTPGIWSEAQVEAWKPIVEAVHRAGGVFFLQLWHTGRMSHPDLHGGALPVSASAVKPSGQAFTASGMKDFVAPRPVELSEIPGIVDDYRHAAANAKRAGFDGVEIHSANGYFLDQWVRDTTNLRTDEYGGSIENRLRFPLEAAAAVVDGFGDASRVGIRISPGSVEAGEPHLDSTPNETYGRYMDALRGLGLVYLHAIEGTAQQTRAVTDNLVDYQALRRHFAGTFMDNNMLDAQLAARLIGEKQADLVVFGRDFLANPDLVERLRTGEPLRPVLPKEFWYGGGEKGYSDLSVLDK